MRQFLYFALVIVLNVLIAGCGDSRDPMQTRPSSPGESPTEPPMPSSPSNQIRSDILPGIQTFLTKHMEFGTPSGTESMPDWWQGKRQRIQFTSGRNLLFYLKDGRVVSVYEDTKTESRKRIWNE